jgi:hypothetical protein
MNENSMTIEFIHFKRRIQLAWRDELTLKRHHVSTRFLSPIRGQLCDHMENKPCKRNVRGQNKG